LFSTREVYLNYFRMADHNYAILLAGGQGSRFWPQSRTLEPKQFLSLHQKTSLFDQTIIRIKPLIPPKNIIIATSELYRHQVQEIAAKFNIPSANLIFEPDGRNTAPSIALAVQLIACKDKHARICVLPCDHLIKNPGCFRQLLEKGLAICDDHLIIFGIPPHRPATGYGYIKAAILRGQSPNRLPTKNELRGLSPKEQVYLVAKFCEKPDLKTAAKLLKAGNYFWNSGIFVGSCDIFLKDFRIYLPKLHNMVVRLKCAADIVKIWNKIQPISFDYGILEKSNNLRMLIASGLGWSDLGSWQAWDEILEKDKEGNVFKADVINLRSKNITVLGNNRLIATIGLDDLIIVDTPDALLITKKGSSEEVKKIVDTLKTNKRQEHYSHKTVKRPWGSYTILETGEGFKVKLVEVKPKHSLSLQLHKKRSEHWVVVEGIANIVRGKKTEVYNANESTYIPINCIHRLTNPTTQSLKIIEVQAGKYLEEDDIVRLKDDFGR